MKTKKITYINKKIAKKVGFNNFIKDIDYRLLAIKELIDYEVDKVTEDILEFGFSYSIVFSVATNYLQRCMNILDDLSKEEIIRYSDYQEIMKTRRVNLLIDLLNDLIGFIDDYNLKNKNNDDKFKLIVKH